MRKASYSFAALLGLISVAPAMAFAVDAGRQVGSRACAALSDRVGDRVDHAPLLLRSYDNAKGSGEPDEPALRTAAFSYDNALAVIALLACDERAKAQRVGDALRIAIVEDSRLRNTYRAGVVGQNVLLNGWWDAKENRWAEDSYQAGSATGNVAWTALAMLALHDATGDGRWLDAATKLGEWVVATTADSRGAGGFNGGIGGFDAAPQRLLWKATEHNIDLAAVFAWLDCLQPGHGWNAHATKARHFVQSQWQAGTGHFLVGTLPDGVTSNRQTSGLDVQLWPLLLRDPDPAWRRAIDYAEREHGVAGGFDFNSDRDGLWLEGTAQAALVYCSLGRDREADALLETMAGQFAPGGFVYATREPRITTGLALSSASASADFYYFHRPHLAATAWAALAARGRNPFRAPGH
ncbi:MAG TPA: hypothetical protein VGH81_03320 [Rudaea sp.]|jgi:hypothetical protein